MTSLFVVRQFDALVVGLTIIIDYRLSTNWLPTSDYELGMTKYQ